MFPRAQLKAFARQRLQFDRGNAIVVALLASLLGGVSSGGVDFINIEGPTVNVNMNSFNEFSSLLYIILSVVVIAALLFGIFVGNVVAVGLHGWFLRYQRGEAVKIGELFAGFRIYKPALCTRLLTDIYTFLWSLLFIIPGIVKGYAYSMANYIIYENPNLSANQAIRMSEKMTDGYKGELFVLELSWIGWGFLNAFTLGILGIVYVNPYMFTTHAAAYEYLKQNAIQSGRLTWEDFGQMPPAYQPPAPPTVDPYAVDPYAARTWETYPTAEYPAEPAAGEDDTTPTDEI